MQWIIEKLMFLAPVLFGLLVFGPMWAAAADAVGWQLHAALPNLYLTMLIGALWGALAIKRERWL
jgi:hypothetical protein